MAGNFENDVTSDRSRISMNKKHEVRYWTEALGCSEDELAAAVARVGNSTDAVRREIHRHWAYGTFRKTEVPRRRRGRPRKRAWTGTTENKPQPKPWLNSSPCIKLPLISSAYLPPNGGGRDHQRH